MANSYSQTTFIIPCTSEIADLVFDAFNLIEEEDESLVGIVNRTDGTFTQPERCLRSCIMLNSNFKKHVWAKEGFRFNVNDYTGFDAVYSEDDNGIRVNADEKINIDAATALAQTALVFSDSDAYVQIEVAEISSRSIVGGSGGYAVFVTKDRIEYCWPGQFLAINREAQLAGERYYHCDITEVNGEYEYLMKFLMKIDGDTDPDERIDEILMNVRGNGQKDDDGFVWFGSLGAKNPTYQMITPVEFETMKRFMVVL